MVEAAPGRDGAGHRCVRAGHCRRSRLRRRLLARALVAAGKTSDATRVFASWIAQSRRSYKSAYVMAEAELALGTPNDVFQWLEKAYRQRDPQLPTGVVDPMWDPVRSDARFIDLARRMNLQP